MSLTTDNGVMPPVVSMVNVKLDDKVPRDKKTTIKAGEMVWFFENTRNADARIPGRASTYTPFVTDFKKKIDAGTPVQGTGFAIATTTILSHDSLYHSIPICVMGVTEIQAEVAENIRAGQVIWFSPYNMKAYAHPGTANDQNKRVPIGRAIHNEKSGRTSGQSRLISVSVRPCEFSL